MRILLVSDVSGWMRGGVTVETVQIIRGLRARGHEVALMGDVPLEAVGLVRHFPIKIPIDGHLRFLFQEASATFKPDVVHLIAMGCRGISRLAGQLKSLPWVLTCHSVPPYERKLPYFHGNENAHYVARLLRFAPNAVIWNWLFRRGVIDHVVVHSERMRGIVRRYGQATDATSLIPLGHEFAWRKNSPTVARSERLRLVTVGGIAHTKGYHDALLAVADLRRDFPDLTYYIIGEMRDPSYALFLEAMIGNLGLSNSVRITLNATDEEKNQALKNSNLYLQPSHEEGFCLAYLEAASVVPLLVGTDTGAIKLISQGDMAARVVAPGQPARIADAVRQLRALSPPRDLLVQREKRLAGYFNWQKYIDAHESLYIRLKADSNPRNEQSNQQQGRAGPLLIHVEEARTQR